MLSDSTGHLFIESKTKRLRMSAKALLDAAALDKDLSVMASAIAQLYKNILDALSGLTRWVPDRRPIYPIVLTLDDWFMFSPPIQETLDNHVRRRLADAEIEEKMIEEMPYTIASAHEFEIASQIIAQITISGSRA